MSEWTSHTMHEIGCEQNNGTMACYANLTATFWSDTESKIGFCVTPTPQALKRIINFFFTIGYNSLQRYSRHSFFHYLQNFCYIRSQISHSQIQIFFNSPNFLHKKRKKKAFPSIVKKAKRNSSVNLLCIGQKKKRGGKKRKELSRKGEKVAWLIWMSSKPISGKQRINRGKM